MQGKCSSLLIGKLIRLPVALFFWIPQFSLRLNCLNSGFVYVKEESMWNLRDPAGEKQQAPGHLSKRRSRKAVKMTLVLSISFADGYRYRLTRTQTTWGTFPFMPPGANLDVWFISAAWDRTIRLWTIDFKGNSLAVWAWHSSGQLALCRNHHNCAQASQRRLCWVSSLPWDLGSLCSDMALETSFLLRADGFSGGSEEMGFWRRTGERNQEQDSFCMVLNLLLWSLRLWWCQTLQVSL